MNLYIITSILSLAFCAVFGCCVYRLHLSETKNCPTSVDAALKIEQGTKMKILLVSLLLGAAFIFCGFRLIGSVANELAFLRLFCLLEILAIAGVIDYKTKKIPNKLIASGVILRAVLLAAEAIYYKGDILNIVINDLVGLAIGFGVLMLSALVTRGSVGYGDVKLFGVIGIMSGAICTFHTLLIALVISVIVSLFLMIVKKKSRKDSIPFGPCVFVGYYISLMLYLF